MENLITRVRDKEHHKKLNRQLEKAADSLAISLIFSNLEVSNNKYCIMITESKVTEIFCIADDFCKEFEG